MKILHIIQCLRSLPGGLERLVLTLLKADFDNTYVLVLEDSLEQAITACPTLADIQSHLVFADLQHRGKNATIRTVRAACQTHSITAVHTHYCGPLLYACLGSLGMKHIKLVHTEHDAWHLAHWKYLFIERTLLTLKKDIRLTAVSHQIQHDLKKYFPRKKTTVVHNAVDTSFYTPGDKQEARRYFNLPASAVIIGSAGRLDEMKGHRFLIEALSRLPQEFHLVIAGNGPLYQDLLTVTAELHLNHRVHFLGMVNSMEVFYQACDLFCLPSLAEGLPLTLLEAQSANLPSVCSDVGGCAEGMDPQSGLLVAPKDTEAIAKACLLVHEKKGEPREFILKNFDLEPLKNAYYQLYLGDGNDAIH